ncbi:MAG TPA: pyridoxal-phosphate dependent enzyme, partial [Crocinitomicaceae bacterium]|nr:pyridoxal-phosphate dependent enzyme [Crocinitomicaceae bacterium]
MNFPDINRSILQELTTEQWSNRNVKVYVKRDDLIHEEISGNKWRKLMYNVELAKNNKNDTLITFGGAFSNHLVATACACSVFGLKSIGIVRGDELSENSNDTLKRCADYGMQLEFVSRELYNLRYDKDWWRELQLDYPNAMV